MCWVLGWALETMGLGRGETVEPTSPKLPDHSSRSRDTHSDPELSFLTNGDKNRIDRESK